MQAQRGPLSTERPHSFGPLGQLKVTVAVIQENPTKGEAFAAGRQGAAIEFPVHPHQPRHATSFYLAHDLPGYARGPTLPRLLKTRSLSAFSEHIDLVTQWW
jgi:hypothetical protein